MRIAIFGTGGAGGYFGTRLAYAGEDIVFIARGAHLQAIKEQGLSLEDSSGEIVVHSMATDDPAQVGVVDAVIVGVKTWQVTDAAQAMRPMIGPQTLVIPLQNGVEAAAQLRAELSANNVLCGLCRTFSWVASPGRIRSIGETHLIQFGELDNQPSARIERLKQIFERAGVNVEVPLDIRAALWEKFLIVVPYGGVGAVTRAPVGIIRSLPETRMLLERGMKEILAIARARQVSLPDEIIEKSMKFIDSLNFSAVTSLHRDISAGKPSELDAWNGAVVRLGKEVGLPTPLHEFLYHSLLPLELRARGRVQFS